MKKIYLILISLFLNGTLLGQTFPNSDFDNWYIGGIDRLPDWITSEGCAMGLDGHMAIYGVQIDWMNTSGTSVLLRTWKSLLDDSLNVSFIYAGNQAMHNPVTGQCDLDLMKTGQAFPYRPDKMMGVYKFRNDSLLTNDYGKGVVILKKFNPITQTPDTIGWGTVNLMPTGWASDTTFIPFEIAINYLQSTSVLPDSIAVAFFSSATNQPGGLLGVDSLTFDFSSSVRSAPNLAPVFEVFPNPAKDFVFIKIKDQNGFTPSTITLTNTLGQVILQQAIKEPLENIALPNLPNGLYFLNINHKNGTTATKKLLIKK